MTAAAEEIIEILNCYLRGEKYTPKKATPIGDIMTEGYRHQLFAIVYNVLYNSGLITDDLSARYEERYKRLLKLSAMQEQAIAQLEKFFRAKRYKYAFFKGSSLRDLYTPPDIRTMGDIDVLLDEADLGFVIEYLSSLGYECICKYKGVTKMNKGILSIELHTRIVYLDRELMTADHINNNSISSTEHLFVLIAHVANHLLSVGCGVRQLLDIAVFIRSNRDSVNWGVLNKLLREYDIADFACILLGTVGRLFDIHCLLDEGKRLTDELTEAVMSGGIFGFYNADNMTARHFVKDNIEVSKTATLFGKVFPAYSAMSEKYPALLTKKYLLPYYYIKRILLLLRRRDTYGRIREVVTADTDRVMEHNRFLERMCLLKEKN